MQTPHWLTLPVYWTDELIASPLPETGLGEDDVQDICSRMNEIMNRVEFERCEGRLTPKDLFHDLDHMQDALHRECMVPVVDCFELAARFGQHYSLEGEDAIRLPFANKKPSSPRSGKTLELKDASRMFARVLCGQLLVVAFLLVAAWGINQFL